MIEKKRTKAKPDVIPNPTPVSNVSGGHDWSPGDPSLTYVVIRYTYGVDMRVSDREYKTANDPRAITEMEFWKRAIKFHSDGTRAVIVKFDKRKHRIW